MKKKLLSTLLAATLALGTMSLAACGGDQTQTDQTQSDTQAISESEAASSPAQSSSSDDSEQSSEAASSEENAAAWTGETSHIIVTYLTLGSTPKDLKMVQDALNARTVPEIGVEVEFKDVSAYDAMALFPQWLATGERIDLMFPLLQPISSYVSQGLIDPLEDLIKENAPYIQKLTDEGEQFATNNTIDGHIYAIAQRPQLTGSSGGFVLYDPYYGEIKDAGMLKDGDDPLYTMEDIDAILAKLKELHPEAYPIAMQNKTLNYSQCLNYDMPIERLGTDYPLGVVMSTDSTVVVNLYESEEYRAYLDWLRKWNEAGYISPDATTTDNSVEAQIGAGAACGYFMSSAPSMNSSIRRALRTSDYVVGTQPFGGWVIPYTAKEPEAAMRFMNLMYEDVTIANLVQWGIEGTHYQVVDAENGIIGFADGVTAETSGYYNTLGLYGDMSQTYVWDPEVKRADYEAYTEKCKKNPYKCCGFHYMPTEDKQAKLAAIQSVSTQYLPSLESGSVDVDEYLPKMIEAFRAAGLDDIIADEQAQLDEFMKNK